MICKDIGCEIRAIYSMFGNKKPEYCKEHKIEGMVDVLNKKCNGEDCHKHRIYGLEQGKPTHCISHKTNLMTNVLNRKCEENNCEIKPTFKIGEERPSYCYKHSKPGYTSKKSKCLKCSNYPSFGINGSSPEYCKYHKNSDMVNVRKAHCIYEKCKFLPKFGKKNGKPVYCDSHKQDNQYNVKSKLCIFEICHKKPSFGFYTNRPEYCMEHKSDTMYNVVNKRCITSGCNINATFSEPNTPPLYCVSHKLDGMVDVKGKKCKQENCITRPSFGSSWGKPTHCAAHKLENMNNVINKKCTSCGLFSVFRKNNFLCYYCQPFPRLLKKEHKVKTLLEEKGLVFTHNKQINNDCCLKYRPDFLFDCGSYFVVLECDENGHADYDKDCEMVRMNNISIGLGLPTLFIRYNPDLPGFKVKQKHRILLETLDKYLNLEILEDPTPVYIFYQK